MRGGAGECAGALECIGMGGRAAVDLRQFTAWWADPKLVQGTQYSPRADADNARVFEHHYDPPVTFDFAATADNPAAGAAATAAAATLHWRQ